MLANVSRDIWNHIDPVKFNLGLGYLLRPLKGHMTPDTKSPFSIKTGVFNRVRGTPSFFLKCEFR